MAKKTIAKPKATALSLHLGLNAVDPVHYGGWSGELAACERDATDMARPRQGSEDEAHGAADPQRHPGQDDRRA